jgi:hypothetical protein
MLFGPNGSFVLATNYKACTLEQYKETVSHPGKKKEHINLTVSENDHRIEEGTCKM